MNKIATQELTSYVDKWVALTSDYSKIVASGNSIPEVEKKLEKTTYDVNNLIIKYILPPDKFLSPSCLV